ncbi:MAG: PAS domain-containing protein, partial [Candidatus Competibacteraceae bacterium]
LYPVSIAADLTPERLARFFTATPDGSAYRIHKSIRDLLVFSEHNVIKDPPFSRLDLISCRNLLIYLNGDLQNKLIPLFHYALNPGGFLFLGTAETVGEFAERLFVAQDRKQRLYQRKDDGPNPRVTTLGQWLPPLTLPSVPLPSAALPKTLPGRLPLRELTEQMLLQQVIPTAVLVNGQGDILYLHGRTGQYLEPAPGEAHVNNILKMAREGLQRDLTIALHQAAATKAGVRHAGLRVKTNGDFTWVNLTVQPLPPDSATPPLYLVILETAAPPFDAEPAATGPAPHAPDAEPTDAEACIDELRETLRAKEEYLQTTQEELETANEELKSTNEEMQSVNEELQSTNEELETSTEELQSVNEELSTVNAELQSKVTSLSQANNDLSNLLAGTGIGTVFVDLKLHILRFTPAVTPMINLILSDVGRPVAHIVSNLIGYDRLVADTQAVLDSLIPTEREVQTTTGRWYTLRILPYRTLDNMIEGAVITFVDITEIVQTREALHKVNDLSRWAMGVRDAHDAITVQDLAGRIIAWNPGAVRLYGWSEAEALALNVRDRIPAALREVALARIDELSRAKILEPVHTQRLRKDGQIVEVSLTATALVNETGQMYAIATTERAKGAA